ncbi:MAG TPA: PTS system mannose/fructose/sorbose family transporter subunit IID [Gemmatimonadaceae bacterium]|jgi:Phosphotransferase system, mannose/fructose/N-acetylgalactosamine-specific component IID
MFTRLLAVQASWNYELMLGPGIGFCTEPALRMLPGGTLGAPYREALARQSRYFNAHPYFAAVAVGALARAELDGSPPGQIERFRMAMCGPLGSLGDQLVWAGWLPLSVLLALLAFGLGAGAVAVLLIFLVVYNVGHVGVRIWGLTVGWRSGLRVAASLGGPILRQGPAYMSRAVMALAGAALPLVISRVLAGLPVEATPPNEVVRAVGGVAIASAMALATILGVVLVRLHSRVEGWRVALVVLAVLIIYSVAA